MKTIGLISGLIVHDGTAIILPVGEDDSSLPLLPRWRCISTRRPKQRS